MLGFPASLAARGNIVAHISTIMGSKGTSDLAVGGSQGKGEILGTNFISKRERYSIFLDTYSLFCFLHVDSIVMLQLGQSSCIHEVLN